MNAVDKSVYLRHNEALSSTSQNNQAEYAYPSSEQREQKKGKINMQDGGKFWTEVKPKHRILDSG